MNKTLISTGTVANNKKARFNYAILETYEAGIMLTGGEVKSLRAGRATINESYASVNKETGELFWVNAHILECGSTKGGFVQHVAGRPRKLLLKKKELSHLLGEIAKKGKTVVPLELYFNNRGLAKVRLGLAIGKNHADKREDIKTRDWNRDKQRILAHYNSGKK